MGPDLRAGLGGWGGWGVSSCPGSWGRRRGEREGRVVAGTLLKDRAPWLLADEAIWGHCPRRDPNGCYLTAAGSGA